MRKVFTYGLALASLGLLFGCGSKQQQEPDAVKQQLPLRYSFVSACPPYPASAQRDERRRLPVESATLFRELADHADWTVTVTQQYADSPDTFEDEQSIKEIAQTQLQGLQTNKDCMPELRVKLLTALSGS
jgi:hypothetical protein